MVSVKLQANGHKYTEKAMIHVPPDGRQEEKAGQPSRKLN